MYVEASKTTSAYAEEIDKMLKAEGKRVNIQTSMKNAIGKNKNDRILAASPEIRQHMVFLESGHRSKEYEQFMQNVFSFKMIGTNKHDDAPDSLQMAITFAFPKVGTKVTVARRTF
jgi:predicted phage terminase large subunit-like protein